MQNKNILKVLLAVLILFVVNCSDPGDRENQLVGKWVPEANTVNATVLTSAEEVYPHFNVQTIGSITISGEIESSLDYLGIPINSLQFIELYSYPDYTPKSYPSYRLMYEDFDSLIRLRLLHIISDTSIALYTAKTENLHYDLSAFSFTCDSIEMFLVTDSGVDSSKSIILNGTARNQTTVIPANTEVKVHVNEGAGEGVLVNHSMTFTEDNNWLGEWNTVQENGTWNLDESLLTIIREFPNEPETRLDTIVREYHISEDILTLTQRDTLSKWDGAEEMFFNWYKQTPSLVMYLRIGESAYKRL